MWIEIFEWKMYGNDGIDWKYVGNNCFVWKYIGKYMIRKGNNLQLEGDKIYEMDMIQGKGNNKHCAGKSRPSYTSDKSSVNTNRKSTMRFSMSLR